MAMHTMRLPSRLSSPAHPTRLQCSNGHTHGLLAPDLDHASAAFRPASASAGFLLLVRVRVGVRVRARVRARVRVRVRVTVRSRVLDQVADGEVLLVGRQ